MLTLVLYGLLAVIVAAVLFVIAVNVLPSGEQIAPAMRDDPDWRLPTDRSLGAADVDQVRLPVALRGYRFAETDILLDRLAGELRDRDAEIARLRDAAPEAALRTETAPPAAAAEPAGPETAAAGPAADGTVDG